MIACATVTFWCIEIVFGRDAEHRREQVAGLAPDLPPAFVPRAHAARRPLVGELLQVVRRLARHRAERMAHQVGAGLEDREFLAPARAGRIASCPGVRFTSPALPYRIARFRVVARAAAPRKLSTFGPHRLDPRARPVGAPDGLVGDLLQPREVLEQLRRRNPGDLEDTRSDAAGRGRTRRPSTAAGRRARAGSSASESRSPRRPRPSDRRSGCARRGTPRCRCGS